ncbi:MAG: Ig-like domain-containing protein [Paludibacter sp.]|nr:Ig-like domain-containing protein [Paludibacter sp.]
MRNKTFFSNQKLTSILHFKRLRGFFTVGILMLVAFTTWQCKDDDFTGEVIGVCPEVILTSPVNGAINVVSNALITATFNVAMDPSSINETTYFIKKGSNLIGGAVTYSGTTATFTPTNLLEPNTVYVATVKRESKDLMGNIMIADEVWSFNTGSAPNVILTDPLEGTSDVALNKAITAVFSTEMNSSSITTGTFKVMQGTTAIPGTVSYSGTMATFTPSSALIANKVYSATIFKQVKDLAGNTMLKDTTWSFATGTLPLITITHPHDGDVNVAIETLVSATFSKMMNPISINSLTFTLKHGTTPVAGVVSYKDMSAIFTPTQPLQFGTEYTATVTTGVRDLANKSIPADSTWKFTTGILIVPVLPYVVSTDPSDGATNVEINKIITATFSKVMDNTTINSSTFKVMNGTTPVLGYVSYAGTEGIFTPASPLLKGVTYNAVITTGAKDLDGNAMANDKRWSFSTIAAPVQYSVTLSALPVAGGTTSGGGNFDIASLVNVTATAASGYTFENWTENGTPVSTQPTYSFTLNGNRNLIANFKLIPPTQFLVTLSALPIEGGTTSGSGLYDIGSSVTVKATPKTGYTFENWTENGNPVSTLATYTFNLSGNKTLIANFKIIPPVQYTATLSSLPIAGGVTNGGGLFDVGTSITVTATANQGYTFENWTENGNPVSTLAAYTFTLNGNRSLVANFKVIPPVKYTASLSSLPIAGGVTNGGGLFDAGSSITVTASPNPGYTFEKWTENGIQVSSLAAYTFTLNGNRSLVANFKVIPPVQYTASLSSLPIAGGTTTGGGLYNAGSTVTAKATANAGYTFEKWTENGSTVSTAATYVFTLNGNRSLVANFKVLVSGPQGIDLGSAGDFAVLAGSGISNTGVSTIITGDVGSFPTATINGLLAGNVNGTLYVVADPIVGLAKTHLTAAFNDAQGRSTNAISLPGQLGGLTLAPGLYVNSSTSGISGTGANGILTLDAGGNPNAVWIFKMGSTLITGAGTSIVLAGGAQAKNIYWSVGTSATLGTTSIFYGNILADQSITITTGATLTGRALTRIGAVTLDSNIVTKP